METTIELSRGMVNRARYNETVNAVWPDEMPKPTGQEAIAATRLLIREGFRFYGMTAHAKQKRKFKLTSGRRHTWPRRGVWFVNPDERGRGWMEIIHSVGHWCHSKKYPDLGGHDISHAAIERHLIRYVLGKGWLQGALRRPEKAKPVVDRRKVKLTGLEARLKRWETKARRADTAIRKLRAAVRRAQA